MLGFELTDSVRAGLHVVRAGVPHVTTPAGCLGEITLDRSLVEAIDFFPHDADIRLLQVGIDLRKNCVLLKRTREKHMALVRIGVAAGEGGRVGLNGGAFDTELVHGRVKPVYRPFPDAGIQVLCSDAVIADANKGVEGSLDILAALHPGAGLRAWRTGRLGDHATPAAAPEMFVWWTGTQLRVRLPPSHHYNEHGLQAPRRYGRASGFLEVRG